MKRCIISISCFCFLIALVIFSETAAVSAYESLILCGKLLIPSLFPFFIAANLLSELDAFKGISGNAGKAAGAFIVGVTAGYPVGASYIAGECKKGNIRENEADSIAVFCSNSGPAFIVGAIGTGVFHSPKIGVILYAIHILSALLGGMILSKPFSDNNSATQRKEDKSLASALTDSVKSSVNSCISVCGYVLTFGVIIGLLEKCGALSSLAGNISAIFGTELSFSRTFICGLLEMGNAVGAMKGLSISPLNLALASFTVSWGGLSVIMQSLSMLSGIKIRVARYVFGRLVIAIISASLTLFVSLLLL